MSYDDLIRRQSVWFSSHQSIQYHVGQFKVLQTDLQDISKETIFVVALTNPSDVKFLDLALKHSISNKINLDVIAPGAPLDTLTYEDNHYKTIPLLYQSHPSDFSKNSSLFGPRKLDNFLEPIIESLKGDRELDIQIALAVITKDHDRRILPGLGSVCIQMLEPFSLQDYLRNALTDHPSSHLVCHIYHDVALSAAILPTQLVAFLILYLEREDGVTLEELIKYTKWFRNISIDINMHMAFIGEGRQIVEFGLLMLDNLINKSKGYYKPKDFASLSDYASPITALIAYQGIISRAILVEHNKSKLTIDTVFLPGDSVRVARDDVISTSGKIAGRLELFIVTRKPCIDVETMIKQEMSKMQLSGRYFAIQEPKINATKTQAFWAGEEDSDEEYFEMNKNKDAFKTWIQLTSNPERLDRLNMFINAVGYILNE